MKTNSCLFLVLAGFASKARAGVPVEVQSFFDQFGTDFGTVFLYGISVFVVVIVSLAAMDTVRTIVKEAAEKRKRGF